MSGHSKFANIKHKKEKNDAKKGKIFTVIGREIAVAVKEGGPDPNNNSKLRDVIAKAKANNMPNDTIDRGIKKAAGNVDAVNYVNITYEGYGPSGTAIIVEALTDNKNRTAANVRNGGRTPIAGIVHAITLLLILLFLMPYASMIPMTCLAAILIMVAYNMSGFKTFGHMIKTAPKSDILVLITTLLLTVFFDLVVAIEIGMVMAAFLFMKRMSDVGEVKP